MIQKNEKVHSDFGYTLQNVVSSNGKTIIIHPLRISAADTSLNEKDYRLRERTWITQERF